MADGWWRGRRRSARARSPSGSATGATSIRPCSDLVRDARRPAYRCALATNATDRLDADLAAFGLADAFDAVVNSSVVGVAKPSPEFFAAACAALGTPPERCLLVDDSAATFVAGARAAGLTAHRYAGPADLRHARVLLGLEATICRSWLVLFSRRPPESVQATMSSIRTPKRPGR